MNDSTNSLQTTGLEIAVIGMAGRFPGAATIDAFWKNIRDGVESITFFADEELEHAGVPRELLDHPNYVKAAPVLEAIDQFDAGLFGYSPKEAEAMDPQQRLFLECAWEGLENAGYHADRSRYLIGVYGGVSMSTYLINLYANSAFMDAPDRPQMAVVLGNDKDFLTTRISYKLNLEGPSLTVQTACSTSLVAVHLACQGLLSGDCDLALAGGASIRVPHTTGYLYTEGAITSPDGHCRAFDAQASGTVLGSGVGVVVLKRLQDALADGDTIHAVIKGSAINNDGAHKMSYTAPRVDGQARVIHAAQVMAEVEPETISYVEAHGTGTKLGDPIEVAALSQAFNTSQTGYCALGSVKSNIGHLDAAAGVAGLIKTIQALKHRQLPPSLHCRQPNPAIDFAHSPFYVNTQLTPWTTNGGPRRAGVSSFGIGGTNAHVVLEEAPPVAASGESRPWQMLLLSAKSPAALETATLNLAAHLRQHPTQPLADVAYTLQLGRWTLDHRRMLVCRDVEDALAALESTDPERILSFYQQHRQRPVVFMFPGQGAQYAQMAADLYRSEPVFQAEIDRCAALLEPRLGLDLRTILYPAAQQSEDVTRQLNQTALAQPALFVIEYALARLWMAWGVQPTALIGHSIGEYVAACLAGVLSLEDALSLVAARGRLMQQVPGGAMLSVSLAEAAVQPLLNEQISIAAINGPGQCVVSGPTEAIEQIERQLSERNIPLRRLHTSHAFHSPMMEPIVEAFAAEVQRVRLHAPQLPYLSNVSGTWITAEQATDPRYWANHIRAAVRFADGLSELLGSGDTSAEHILLEVGPGRALSTFARQHPLRQPQQIVLTSLRHAQEQQADTAFLLTTLGRLWLAGAAIDWEAYYRDERRCRVPLPTYPFEHQRYWVERTPRADSELPADAYNADVHTAEPSTVTPASEPAGRHRRPNVANVYVAPRNEIEETIAEIWQELLGIDQIGVYDNFFELGGHSLIVSQVAARLRAIYPLEIPLDRVFEAQTVAALAMVLVEGLVAEQDHETLTSVLAELEQLTTDDVDELLSVARA